MTCSTAASTSGPWPPRWWRCWARRSSATTGSTGEFLQGFLLLQLANATFAAGQVLYKRLVRRYPSQLPQRQRFGYFFLGALLVALPAWLLFGDPQRLPAGELQWGVLVWDGPAGHRARPVLVEQGRHRGRRRQPWR
ncbi:membrane protein [Pseudomonas aeruginosa]|nr:membrane protein [Pseudomonas aeruginosa]